MTYRRKYHGVQVNYIEPGRAAFSLAGRRYDAKKTTALRERISTWQVTCRETGVVLIERSTISDAIRWMIDGSSHVAGQYEDENAWWESGI